MLPIPINLAVEDELSEAVLRKILHQCGRSYSIGTCYRKGGFGYLRKLIGGLNNAAKGTPFLVLTDLDEAECPSLLIQEWLRVPKHSNLLFRVAVREVEAWVLADRVSFAKFLGIRVNLLPDNPDQIHNTKESLIGVVRNSRRADVREDIVPPVGSTRTQGPNYNGRLTAFIESSWNIGRACAFSPSLRRTLEVLSGFQPVWGR